MSCLTHQAFFSRNKQIITATPFVYVLPNTTVVPTRLSPSVFFLLNFRMEVSASMEAAVDEAAEDPEVRGLHFPSYPAGLSCRVCTRYTWYLDFYASTTRNPFSGSKLLGFSIGRSFGVLEGSRAPRIRAFGTSRTVKSACHAFTNKSCLVCISHYRQEQCVVYSACFGLSRGALKSGHPTVSARRRCALHDVVPVVVWITITTAMFWYLPGVSMVRTINCKNQQHRDNHNNSSSNHGIIAGNK